MAQVRTIYIPSAQISITLGQYVDMYKKCKSNPSAEVKMTICKWWPGTAQDVLDEIMDGIHDRINQKMK
jgi:hypothetical protein